MSRRDFADDTCSGCGAPLDKALRYDKRAVTYVSGEFTGSDGLDVIVLCACGVRTRIAFSVDLRPAA